MEGAEGWADPQVWAQFGFGGLVAGAMLVLCFMAFRWATKYIERLHDRTEKSQRETQTAFLSELRTQRDTFKDSLHDLSDAIRQHGRPQAPERRDDDA